MRITNTCCWCGRCSACCPQLHLELSRYETLGDVEALCGEFGAERLLYGSWYPRYEMGPILYYLHHTTADGGGAGGGVRGQRGAAAGRGGGSVIGGIGGDRGD